MALGVVFVKSIGVGKGISGGAIKRSLLDTILAPIVFIFFHDKKYFVNIGNLIFFFATKNIIF